MHTYRFIYQDRLLLAPHLFTSGRLAAGRRRRRRRRLPKIRQPRYERARAVVSPLPALSCSVCPFGLWYSLERDPAIDFASLAIGRSCSVRRTENPTPVHLYCTGNLYVTSCHFKLELRPMPFTSDSQDWPSPPPPVGPACLCFFFSSPASHPKRNVAS